MSAPVVLLSCVKSKRAQREGGFGEGTSKASAAGEGHLIRPEIIADQGVVVQKPVSTFNLRSQFLRSAQPTG